MFTLAERTRRLSEIEQMLQAEGLTAAVIVGNGSVGPGAYGNYRYFVDNRVYYHMQLLVMIRGQEPIVCCSTRTHLNVLNARGFQDVRLLGERLIEGTIDVLKEKNVCRGRVGISMDVMPAGWYQAMTNAFPAVEFVDIQERLFRIRMRKCAAETEIVEACAGIAEQACQALCRVAREGITEQELTAELDYVMKRAGAEETLTLLGGSARGPEGIRNRSLRFAGSSPRQLEGNSCVTASIAPRYQGYWTRETRSVCIGEPDGAVKRFHDASLRSIDAAAILLVPGTPIGAAARAIQRSLEKSGFRPAALCGHLCGVDLVESPLLAENDLQLQEGMAITVQPAIMVSESQPACLWGETYLVTADGGKRLADAERTLPVL